MGFGASIVILVRNVYKRLSGRLILKDISFEVPEPSVVAVLGPNGSGKSTLMRILAGLLIQDKGLVKIYDLDPFEFRGWIGYAQESDRALIWNWTVWENLYSYGRLRGVDKEVLKERIFHYCRLLGVEEYVDTLVGRLSTGLRKRVILIRALLNDPRVLILDEALSGIDVEGVVVIKRLLTDLYKKGVTIFLSQHDVGRVIDVAKRVIILSDGEIVFDEPIEVFDDFYKRYVNLKAVIGESHLGEFQSIVRRNNDVIQYVSKLNGDYEVKVLIQRSNVPVYVDFMDRIGSNLELLKPMIDDLIFVLTRGDAV